MWSVSRRVEGESGSRSALELERNQPQGGLYPAASLRAIGVAPGEGGSVEPLGLAFTPATWLSRSHQPSGWQPPWDAAPRWALHGVFWR
jgi:hypothetical protein